MVSRRPPAPRNPRGSRGGNTGRGANTGRAGSTGRAGAAGRSGGSSRGGKASRAGSAPGNGPSKFGGRSRTRGASKTNPAVERGQQHRPPRLFTIRFAMLFVIAIFALVTLFPTVRAYLTQRAEIAELEQEVEAAEQREADLRAELSRWEDPAYVAAQARERLAFVMPGETAYKVIDPGFVEPEEPALGEGEVDSGLPALEDLVDVSTDQPWYSSIQDSIRVAGEN